MRRYSIQFQLAALVTLAVALSFSILFLVALRHTNELIRSQEERADAAFVRSVFEVMEGRLNGAELALRTVAFDPEVKRLLAQRERFALEEFLVPVWEAVSPSISRFHVHLPDSTSFVRLHDPERYGDDLSSFRPMVRTANAELRTVRGIEVGLHGLSQRVVMPVAFEGTHVGSVEFGIVFDEAELKALGRQRPADYLLYRVDGDGASLVASTSTTDPCVLGPLGIEAIQVGTTYSTTSCSFRDRVVALPLEDFSGSVVAYLKMVSDRSGLENGLRAMRYQLSMLAIVTLILVPVLTWVALGRLLRPLTAIVDQTRQIADRITGGSKDFTGDVSATSPDFREVIVEINRIVAALRSSELQKQAILDGFPGTLYLVDARLTVVWANEAALDHRPDMIGRNLDAHESDGAFLECERCVLSDAIAGASIERGLSWTEASKRTDDRRCWEYVAVPILTHPTTVGNVVMIAWDVTEKMTTQEALEERVAEEISAREQQEQMVFQQAKLAAIGELAAGIAHEVNQPLNTLSFAFENLVRRIADSCIATDEIDAKRTTIVESLERIRSILDHVRTFSREQLRDFSEPFDVNESVRRAASLIATQYQAHGVELTVTTLHEPIVARGNTYELEQVVLNLCSNAWYAAKRRVPGAADNPRVSIVTGLADGKAEVTVSDNGEGIPEAIRERVMEPFFTTKGPQEGTGLGLSISYGIVEKMGGTLGLESRLGHGTTVRVRLPVYEALE